MEHGIASMDTNYVSPNAQQIYDPCPNFKSSGSIDDFLAHYRLEDTSIQSFLSCLEEPMGAEDQESSTSEHLSSTYMLDQGSDAVCSTSTDSSFADTQKTNTAPGRKRTSAPDQLARPADLDGNLETNEDSEDERRRIRNREYQRRFRAKKIRQEMQAVEALRSFHF